MLSVDNRHAIALKALQAFIVKFSITSVRAWKSACCRAFKRIEFYALAVKYRKVVRFVYVVQMTPAD